VVIAEIDEVKNSDSSTDVNDSIEDVNDFLVTASAATVVNCLEFSSTEIADREIKIWKTRTVPFPKDKNPLDEWRQGAVHLFPWLGVLARRVLAIPTTSATPERLFSTAGNAMTKKRSMARLTCDNMEELVYLHEVCLLGGGQKDALGVIFFELMKKFTFNVFSCLLFDSETLFEPHLSCVC